MASLGYIIEISSLGPYRGITKANQGHLKNRPGHSSSSPLSFLHDKDNDAILRPRFLVDLFICSLSVEKIVGENLLQWH
ncbi:hypothetical protein TIFTF001_012925 [Ficus carica]|uniref:Uncharacterized protein n=1 Tax=Ficus carica TaxID=3494 RepID=A0AA88D6R3_FICCA|nr:hypothetical protein TIFTF001_012925 [Ficus carica]